LTPYFFCRFSAASRNWPTVRERDNGNVGADALNLGLSDGQDKVVLLRSFAHGESLAVQQLVLKDDDGVGIADSGFEKSLRVLGAPRGDDLETEDRSVPSGIVLRMLRGHTGGETGVQPFGPRNVMLQGWIPPDL
jgi:hypothetical protein